MYVYVIHRQSASSDDVYPMEVFPSQTRAMYAFVYRVRDHESAAYPMVVNGVRPAWGWTNQKFPLADASGYLAVWHRTPADLPPGPADAPGELWTMTPTGTVHKQPWPQGMEAPPVVEAPLSCLSSAQRRTRALQLAAAMPDTVGLLADVAPDHMDLLRDLVPDAAMLDAVMRVALDAIRTQAARA